MRITPEVARVQVRVDNGPILPPRPTLNFLGINTRDGQATDNPSLDQTDINVGQLANTGKLIKVITKAFTSLTPPDNELQITIPEGQTWKIILISQLEVQSTGADQPTFKQRTTLIVEFTETAGTVTYKTDFQNIPGPYGNATEQRIYRNNVLQAPRSGELVSGAQYSGLSFQRGFFLALIAIA